MNKSKLVTVTLLIAAAAAERIIAKEAGLWNFAPLGATALFSGAIFGRKWIAFLLPFIALVISDLLLAINGDQAYVDFISSGGFLLNYASYPLIILMGTMMHKNVTAPKVLMGSLAASAAFFLVSNFIVWAGGAYTMNFKGLMLCYEAGLPFIKSTIKGDLAFSAILFGSYYLISTKVPSLKQA